MDRNKKDKRWWVKLTGGLMMIIAVSTATVSSVSDAAGADREISAETEGEFDPWEPFNSKMFWFNHDVLDRYVLKPIAKAWNLVLPEAVQHSLRNAVDNTNMPSRMVNSLAQGKFAGAARELARFTINTTIGVGGLLDVAKDGFGIDKSDEDTGQSLGFYGVGPGPYLVLPFFPPTDIRDGLGTIVDGTMNPLNYILPFAAGANAGTTVGTLAGIAVTDTVNQRSLNLEFYEGVEETVIDLYSAVRNGYLQKREAKIKE